MTHRKFKECPLGTRFSYVPGVQGHEYVYVILSHYGDDGCGKVARWGGEDGPVATQGVYSAAETEQGCDDLIINTIVWTPLRNMQCN